MAKRDDTGRRLRTLRDQLELTQEVVAARSWTTTKYLSQIENGHASPTIGVLRRIVEQGLGASLATLYAEAADAELATLQAVLGTLSAAERRRALRVIRAMVED